MDTNPTTQQLKEIASVEILHLDELGYGPQGKHTRREWRKECLKNLSLGKERFIAWQKDWELLIDETLNNTKFGVITTHNDGSKSEALTVFEGIQKPYFLDFSGQKFHEDFNLTGYVFERDVSFSAATFTQGAYFGSAKFNGDAYFSRVTFTGIAYFHNAKFLGSSYFGLVRFKSLVYFNSSLFIGETDLSETKFIGTVTFDNAKFTVNVDFSYAVFNNYVNFTSAQFSHNVNFISVTFRADVNFSNAVFHRKCHFENWFIKATNKWTKETSFEGKINFENAVFKNVGHFERVRFLKHTPAFRGCQIDSTRLEFSDDSYFPRNESSEDAVKNISFLKRLSDEHGQTDQALNFNAMELRAKRLQTDPKPAAVTFKVMTWLYEVVSDYGRSFTLPLFWYGLLIWFSYLFAMGIALHTPKIDENKKHELCKTTQTVELPNERAAFEYAMFRAGGVMDFTDTGKQNNSVNCTLFGEPIEPPLMRAWGIFKGIASLALLFLAALGLRNKYRIK